MKRLVATAPAILGATLDTVSLSAPAKADLFSTTEANGQGWQTQRCKGHQHPFWR